MIRVNASLRERGDIFFAYPAVRRYFEWEMKAASRKARRGPVERMVQLAVPDTSALSLRDIVRVRTSSEHLDKWRRDLTDALIAVDILGEGKDWRPLARQIFADHLSASANALQRESSSRRVRRVATDALRTFAFSAVGAGTLIPLGDSALGIAGSAVSGAASAVYTWASSVQRRRRDRALLAHYASIGGQRGR